MNSKFQPATTFAVAISSALFVWSALAADPAPQPATENAYLVSYLAPGGENYFALSLKVESLPSTATARDHVLLVDTSASQAGEHRLQSLQVARALLAALPETDRVCVMAVDVQADRLTEQFVSPSSDEATAALDQLSRRVPLGATNMGSALSAARDAFEGDRARSLIYIGDGMSTARLIDSPAMTDLVSAFRQEETPVHSYAIGPRTDLNLLGVLALHTGGVVIVDDGNQIVNRRAALPESREVGRLLAAAAVAPVFYPESFTAEPAQQDLYPATIPPLRADRETFLLGFGLVDEDLEVDVSGQVAGTEKSFHWTVTQNVRQPGNTFLKVMYEVASNNNGLFNPLAGKNLFNLAREGHERRVAEMVALGQQALAGKNFDNARQIAWDVQSLDPNNVEARGLLESARNQQQRPTRGVSQLRIAQADPDVDAPPAAGQDGLDDVDDTTPRPAGPERSLLEDLEERRIVRAQQLSFEVNARIEFARRIGNDDPGAALDLLKRQINTVVAATDIDPEIREQLRSRLESVRLEILSRQETIEIARIERERERGIIESQKRLVDAMRLDEARLEQLIDRVRSLMLEGIRGNEFAFEEAEAVARAATALSPRGIEAVAAVFNSEAAGQLDQARRLRALRADKFLAVLQQVELSHVPFPDEPPILWPAPEVWKALSERRKKWASVDLKRYNKIEERLRAALDEPTEMEFIDTPLRDVITFIKDFHNIEIWLNEIAMQDEGIQTDTLVTLNISGISLRSGLKLLLEPLQLTYIIEDEVMKITTSIDAQNVRSVRVYPVGDLVIPIQSGGLGLGVGGLTGGLGGGNQFGGGSNIGGLGGGFGGGGFGGGGLGAFSVPTAKLSTSPVSSVKKSDTKVEGLLNEILGPQAQTSKRAAEHLVQGTPNTFNSKTLNDLKKKPVPAR